jgi:uncharacterized membrane protein
MNRFFINFKDKQHLRNHFPTHKVKQKEWIILLLCGLIGFALRYYTFDHKSLWLDEVYTYNDARYGLNDQLK